MVTALFGSTSTTATTGVGADLLAAWAQSKAGIGVNTATATQDPNAPLAPVWQPGISPSAEVLVQRALTNKAFFDTSSKLYSDLGATGDYQKLFALYSGLSTLNALAARAGEDGLSALQKTQTATAFGRGMTELEAFFRQQQFDDMRLAQGDRVDKAQSTLGLPVKTEDYTTGIIHKGGLYDKISGLDPNAEFEIVATSSSGTVRNVAIDLSEMGSITRTLSNVVSFINGKLSAAGASSRIETVDQTPKTNTIVLGGKAIESRYTGPKQYALKVDVRASEKVEFKAVHGVPAFYALGSTGSSTRLIKIEDVGEAAGQPVWLTRPVATDDPIGAWISTGWYGVDGPAPAGAIEQRSNALVSDDDGVTTSYEDLLNKAGEAVLKLDMGDGRVLSVSTAWRSGDQEQWRTLTGEGANAAMLNDVAERLTQLLHEQGVAAGVDVWEDDGQYGLSVFSVDGLRVSNLSIGGKSVVFETTANPGSIGGLNDGVFARRYGANGVAATSDLFVDKQTFVFTTATTTHSIVIDGGEDGIDAETLMEKLNEQLRSNGIAAAAYLDDNGGALDFRVDALHDVIGVSAVLNDTDNDTIIQAPGAWANGGLPVSGPGELFANSIRTYNAASSPLLTHTDALDLQIVVGTPTGQKTVSVSVTAQERLDNPDAGPGEWNAVLQDRLNAALNEAGVYLAAPGGDLSSWQIAEGSGQRLLSVTVNGDAVALEADAPTLGLGGAFTAERSFTSSQAATGVADDVTSLLSDDNVSITINTIWGERTISAALEPGDPRTLESAALRLNEALAAQGYDVGVAATALSDGGAGLRVVTGASHTVRGVSAINLGGEVENVTLDPIDAVSHVNNPVGALRVYDRASRGATITEVQPSASTFTSPTSNSAAWFPGRAFDISVGGGAKVATARDVATGPDGSVYVLADLNDDGANTAVRGSRDVALIKYDSAGKLVFTQMLGAVEEANGFALAVSADGKVAVAGSVEGVLSGTSVKGKDDSFVTVFDASGKELWTARRGATADDQVNDIAFASDGSLVVVGQTSSVLTGAIALGGVDAYVRGYNPSGVETFTRQFGTGGADAATALLVRDNGSGGIDIVTGGVENNRGVLRSFTYSSTAGFSTGATRDLGNFHEGSITSLAADGASLYVGGQIVADRLTLGATGRASVAGKEGFVARLDVGLVSTALDRASYLGSSQDDIVKSIAIVDGDVYASGVSGGLIAGQGASKSATSFISRLDGAGEVDWMRSFSSSAGQLTLTTMAVDESGASALDILGLPQGVVASNDSGLLVNRSGLRVGDEFQIGVDGRRLTTIKITDKDTLSTLAASINRAISGAGRATIVKADGVERIEITPSGDKAVRLDAGRDGKNALPALGLIQGVVASNASAGRAGLQTYGLGMIASELKLDTAENIAKTKAEISAAISIVRIAYDALLNPNAKALTEEERALEARRAAAASATPPAYLSAQLANYQAALAKLGGS
ncbi:hypothetical protein [Vitreimonas flagellata]|uniref:hypothetical protein n=1 Tax=Vitreimonas flagellata TaxID=2560861 RepID=UPI001074FC3F|nr:hypothetical protein [Vitreimonas flagellata]